MTTLERLDVGPGTVFGGDFTIVRPLRVGGMGAVYVAEQRSTGTLRALKVMQRELVTDPTFRERFELEACIAAKIESDHVVQVVGAGVDLATSLPWMAMELLKGVPLDVYLVERRARPPGEVRFLFEQLCHALGAAHEQGIVHRDLKPANIFLAVPRVVGLSYMVKVLDFGIAKVLAEAKTAKTAAVGTPLYMAPEQYEAGSVTPATDVWALGLIAFELLTGKSYWKAARDGNATPASLMYETCLGELVTPTRRTSEIGLTAALPEGFDAWFVRCVERKPEARFSDARAAFEALARVLGPARPTDEPLPTMTASEGSRVAPTAAMSGSGTASIDAVATVVPHSRDDGRPAQADAMVTALGTPAVRPLTADRPLLPPAAMTTTTQPKRSRAAWLVGAAGIVAVAATALVMRGTRPSPPTPTRTAAIAATSSPSGISPTNSTKSGLAVADPTRFVENGAIVVEGHVMHQNVAAAARTETYLMLELHGADVAPKAAMPVHLSLVIDRSGSMKGGRLESAIASATQAIARLRDGDRISVVAFDQSAQTIVAPTTLDVVSRANVIAAVKKLTLGGDTCMSCGLVSALALLGGGADEAKRVVLLSDGRANLGVKDAAGFDLLGQNAAKSDVNITTIGVGDDYDSKSLVALAHESNGQHYYAQKDADLTAIFDAQAQAFASVVATHGEAVIKLAPGVKLVKVLDRMNRIDDLGGQTTVHVPLGQFARSERKTVLIRIAVEPTGTLAQLATVDLSYREVGASAMRVVSGSLAVPVGGGAVTLDPIVEARVKRSETAEALLHANLLVEAGKAEEASKLLADQSKALGAQKKKWAAEAKPDAPNPFSDKINKDVDEQQKSVDDVKTKIESANEAAKSSGQKPAAMPAAKSAANKAANDAYSAGY